MASTKLVRKDRRNKMRAIALQNTIQRMSAKPVIKKVDIEEIKKSFEAAK
ncbi:hypothetical protein [Sediminitomix flava]|uniref:Uncharacterized protein n=1 Tax=Sediminitomix flava TaxID=379075 RepID=A0A315ZJ32_SEDFL|nr:hypothetical protein [Sediminitomix flava]PWJ44704.1 hypothetical protein BC781_1011075 [Sediminitomix flava]